MRSEYCEFLTQMQKIADKDAVIIEARHHDVLDFYFTEKKTPEEAYAEYMKFRDRWYAINGAKPPFVGNLYCLNP